MTFRGRLRKSQSGEMSTQHQLDRDSVCSTSTNDSHHQPTHNLLSAVIDKVKSKVPRRLVPKKRHKKDERFTPDYGNI
jgi:hypothetical protein